jgi:hypothetical protein
VGALLTLDNFTGIGFRQTWPVLPIAFGLIALLCGRERPPHAPPPS